MRKRLIVFGLLLVVGLAGCTAAPAPSSSRAHPAPTTTLTHAAAQPAAIVIAASGLTVTDASGSVHRFPYDQWSDNVVALSTNLLGVAPRTSSSTAEGGMPPRTTYLWPGMFLIHSDWTKDAANAKRLTVYAQGEPTSSITVSTPSGVRVGDAAAALARYPVFCNVDKKCFQNVATSSGASTTLRVLDSSDGNLVIAYVDATNGVTDIITADSSWGTKSEIDVRD